MSDFPKWLLALAGISLLPVLLSPFYLFGAHLWHKRQRFSPSSALYLYAVALAASPVIVLFSLDLYRRGFERAGISLAVCSALIAVGGGVCLFA